MEHRPEDTRFHAALPPCRIHSLQPSETTMTEQPSQAVQDYLKAIHSLGGAEETVSPIKLADRLQVRAPSVTGMLKRLADAGWIEYVSGTGARLTEQGIT